MELQRVGHEWACMQAGRHPAGMGLDYFNMPVDFYNTNMMNDDLVSVIDSKNALIFGNSFKDEYEGYKNYKPKKIVVNNEREAMLLKIQELDFIINDLNLKLDLKTV